jgi:hypothetical protein
MILKKGKGIKKIFSSMMEKSKSFRSRAAHALAPRVGIWNLMLGICVLKDRCPLNLRF